MKKIKLLLPLWLVLLYLGSAYYMFQTRTENQSQYLLLVETARNYAGNEILTDAAAAYEEALAINPGVELAVEAGQMYLDKEVYTEAGTWYRNELYADYPQEPATYVFGVQLYLAQENYREAFAVYEECENRGLVSDEIEELMRPVLYSFDLSGNYDGAGPYGNVSGIAAVMYDGYWGYIDTEGDRVLDYLYSSAGVFGDLAAVVDKEGNAYFTDSDGNKKITEKAILEKDPEFGSVERFLGIESGLLWAYNGTIWNCYDAETLEKLFGGYSAVTNITGGIGAAADENGKWALISSEGELLTDFSYDGVLTDEKQIFCRTTSVFVKEGEAYRLLDTVGQPLGEAVYEDACAFYDATYAAVKQGGEWFFIDSAGNRQELGTYEEARSFSNGLAAICQDGKWGYIDQEGTLVIGCQFEEAGAFSATGAAFVRPEGSENWKLLRLYKDNHD